VNVEGGEADAGDAEGVTLAKATGEDGGFDGDAADAAAVGEADEGSGLLDDAGEHGYSLQRSEIRDRKTVDSGQGLRD
jgi:hypothetical protein